MTAKVRHPERRRGIWERFLSEFTLSLVEGVEMTTLCAFARDIPSFGCGSAALGLCGEYSFTVNPEEP